MTGFVLNMTGIFLNMTEIVLNMNGIFLHMTEIVLNMTGLNFFLNHMGLAQPGLVFITQTRKDGLKHDQRQLKMMIFLCRSDGFVAH